MLLYAGTLKNFNFFGASDAERVNLQHVYILVKVLRVFHQYCEYFISIASVLSVLRMFYQFCECFIGVTSVLSKNRLFEFSSTSIYQTSIVCIPFSLN